MLNEGSEPGALEEISLKIEFSYPSAIELSFSLGESRPINCHRHRGSRVDSIAVTHGAGLLLIFILSSENSPRLVEGRLIR